MTAGMNRPGARSPAPALGLPLLLLALLLALAAPGLSRPALAQNTSPQNAATAPQPAAAGLTPEEARRALDVLQNDARRRDVITTLEAIARTAPPPHGTPASGTTAAAPAAGGTDEAPKTPAPPADAAPAAGTPDRVSLQADGILAQLIVALSGWFGNASDYLVTAGRTVGNVPLVWDWMTRTATNPYAQSTALDAGWKLVLVCALAWTARRLASRALRRPTQMVIHRAEEGVARRRREREAIGPEAAGLASRAELRFLRRLPLALLRLLLELLPIAAFAAVGNLLLATPLNDGWTVPLIILAAVNAYVIQHIVMAICHMLASPDHAALRLFDISDETAAYIEVWLARISRVVVYGMAVLEIARVLGLYSLAYMSAAKLLILITHLMMVVVVLQCRKPVAEAIAAPHGSHTAFALARNWLAAIWHVLAIFLILAIWFVWAVEIRNGYGLLFRYFGLTVVVLVVARLVTVGILGLLDRIFRIDAEKKLRLPFLEERANRYYPALRRLISLAMTLVTVLAVLQVWGVDAFAWFHNGRLGERIANSAVVVLIAALVAVVIWELTNSWVDRQITDMAARGDYARSARLRTLLPLLRTALLTAILIVVGFTALSQLGVNIAPLLAGASIIGVALGFGSQKLVQDVINGMFLLLENAMQVGDWVTVSGLSGSVEALSVRTIRLRAGDGSVHVIPFSSVTTVTNTNKGVGNAAVSVTVASDEDTDRVGEVLKEIGAGLRQDPAFRDNILDDFALWGVDKVDGATATVVGQMKCRDSGRWGVQREFNRRIKKRFQELGIQIAVPAQAIILARAPRDEEHRPEPAPAKPKDPSGAETRSPPPSALSNTE
ncbi:mechanosensitive ion channel [Roseomonas gilardii subsp. gilardii]|uniref:mechanosensitive ion channel family protein n=1 Tax=Roseomonas gilardii TaxID=257708 RepID=UPI001FF9B895|nr:mechanosensitive ion channel domain-containing protein [Roseomonas gilardii]UPG71634.1 mechanosensitive ion channel [Roseomonas gilardii subsp. gilardii]